MRLYWGSGSPVSWRVQLALALKGIDYDSHRLDLANREHRGAAFKRINPNGTFPVLVDGDVVIRDSLAILAYVDRKHPRPPLLGANLPQTAAVWQMVCEHDAGIGSRANTITQALFRDEPPGDLEPVREAVTRLGQDLEAMTRHLTDADWLVGDTPSAAEAAFYPTIHRVLRAAGKPLALEVGLAAQPLAGDPLVATWLSRVKELPGVDDTYPPHWRKGG